MTDDSFYIVKKWMITDLKLKGDELSIYAILYGFSYKGGVFYGGNTYLAELAGCCQRQVTRILKSLLDKGLIKRITKVVNGRTFFNYAVTLKEKIEQETKEVIEKTKEKFEETKEVIKEKIENTKEVIKEKIPPLSQIFKRSEAPGLQHFLGNFVLNKIIKEDNVTEFSIKKDEPLFCPDDISKTQDLGSKIYIGNDFKIDYTDDFFQSYRLAPQSLTLKLETWLIKNKLGKVVDKNFICTQITSFAQREGILNKLLGL